MAKATYNGVTLADSNETIIIESNHYFPPSSVDKGAFTDSDLRTTCHWKGEASYYHLEGAENAAWYYPELSDKAKERVGQDFSNYVAFYSNIVDIED